jgi:hypothetical protein
MLPRDLAAAIDSVTIPMNREVANGLVTSHQRGIPEYIHAAWRVVAKQFPPGLEYRGYRIPTPREEFQRTAQRGSARPATIDVARCDLRYVIFDLAYNGEPLPPTYLQLPWFNPGGVIYLSGSRYVYSPVMSDSVISVAPTGVFAQLLQIKLVFNRENYYFTTNSHAMGCEIVPVVWSRVWNGKVNIPAALKIPGETTIVHYILAKYGFQQAFSMFAKAAPVYGTEQTINEENYPRSEWLICQSSNARTSRRKKRYQETSELRIAIRHTEYSHLAKAMIAGVFYISDRFTYRSDYMNLDDTTMWQITLGLLIFGTDRNEGSLQNDIRDHISSMDQYVDDLVKRKLALHHRPVDDIYQLFVLILEKIDDWIIANDSNGNSMQGKELVTLYKLLFDITRAIVRFTFELKKGQRGISGKRTLTIGNVKDCLASCVTPGLIFGLKTGHAEMSVDASVNPFMPWGCTGTVTPQDRTAGSRGDEVSSSRNITHATWVGTVGFNAPSKAQPSGVTRLNPYVYTDSDGLIAPHPAIRDKIIELAKILAVSRGSSDATAYNDISSSMPT